MTSLLLDRRDRTSTGRAQRPLVLIATLGGAAAALAPLLVCVAVGVIGWFAADAGAHGAPRDGMRMGAVAWLMAHGSGITVRGVAVGAVPLGLTVICAWSIWRLGHRVGDALSGHGPDADRISDGERDLTVPLATGLFFIGYALVAVVTATLTASVETTLSVPHVILWSVAMTLAFAGPGIAIGSGRAAIWATFVPAVIRQGAATAIAILTAFLALSAVVFLVSLAFGIGEAATMMSQLHLSAGEGIVYAIANGGFLPNASLFSGSFLLGPGFAVGGNTLVSPGAVVLGPLPLFALLAALPTIGTPGAVVSSLVWLPPLVAALATMWWQRRHPALTWLEAALRGCGGGIVAGLAFAVLASVAGGAVGPGRMRFVGPFVPEVLVAAITAFGLGGLLGALVMAWYHRRSTPEES
ncbi:MAG: DUF6350 family protein [Nocardioides sp.]|uniref:cell division protein PerM n=1 Tax=Nocardioides sp. TaxID=35761 RepID=UPI0032631166